MEEIADYYVTLKPIRDGGVVPVGMRNIAFVNDPAVEEMGVYLSKSDSKVVANEKAQLAILEHLKSCGVEKPINWIEVSEAEYLEARKLNLSTDPTDSESFNDFPKKGGGGQWLVRYKYEGPLDDKNRSFCHDILKLDRLYTEEEIINGLSNSEFGNYSIFDYKGSYGCRHVWKRHIYFEDFEDDEVRRVGNVPQVTSKLDDRSATTLNAFLSSDEKMQVIAPLLIPDKKIPRNDEIGRWNMIFSKDTIQELYDVALTKEVFKKTDLYKDTHDGGIAPSYVIEAWLSLSADDKAYTEFGFDINRMPIGTLFVHSQVTDLSYWNNEIKANGKHAYSIEALMNLSIVKLSKQDENLVVQTPNKIKMEKDKIVLPDGEHLINGKIYIVKDGVVVETKEVTPEQEDVIEEVAEEKKPEEMAEAKPEEKKEELAEEKPATEEEKPKEELAETPMIAEEKPEEKDRVAKLESKMEEILTAVAELRNDVESPKEEEVQVEMSDNRPAWKKLSDGIMATRKNK